MHPESGNTLVVYPDRFGRAVLDCGHECSAAAIASAARFAPEDVAPFLELAVEEVEMTAVGLPRAIRAMDAKAPEPIEFAVDEILIAGELAIFAGEGGSFKSTCGYHFVGAIAGGYSVFNRFPTRPRAALIVDVENPEGVILNRLDAICSGHGWDRDRVLSNVHVIASHEANLWSRDWQAHILAEARRLDAGYIQFDPWAELIQGEENSNSESRPIIKYLRRVAKQTSAAVAVVCHAPKAKPEQRTSDRVRGASALRDAARCGLFFEERPEGIAIEHFKMSRSEKLAPFVVTRAIESSPESRGVWVAARFTYQSSGEAVLSRAESFVLDQVTASPGMLNSSDLRSAGKHASIRNEDTSSALSSLQKAGKISFTAGARGARLWSPTTLPSASGNLVSDVAHLAQTSQGNPQGVMPEPVHLAAPTERQARWTEGASGQGGQARRVPGTCMICGREGLPNGAAICTGGVHQRAA